MSLWVHKFIQEKQCCEGLSLHGVVSEFKTLAFNAWPLWTACKSDSKEGTDVRIGFFEFGDGGGTQITGKEWRQQLEVRAKRCEREIWREGACLGDCLLSLLL
jgi:hypothetical protein